MNVADWNEAIFYWYWKKTSFLIESGWWKKWLALKYFEIHFLLSKTTQEWVYRDTFESAINFGGPGIKSSELRTNHNWKTKIRFECKYSFIQKNYKFLQTRTYIHTYISKFWNNSRFLPMARKHLSAKSRAFSTRNAKIWMKTVLCSCVNDTQEEKN